MTKKRAIPQVPQDPARQPFDQAVKENLEVIMGQRGGRVEPLPPTATLPELVAKVNELIQRLQ